MENQNNTLINKACVLLKERLLSDDISPLVLDLLKCSPHSKLEDAILELTRSELLLVALLQFLTIRDTESSKARDSTPTDLFSGSTSQKQPAQENVSSLIDPSVASELSREQAVRTTEIPTELSVSGRISTRPQARIVPFSFQPSSPSTVRPRVHRDLATIEEATQTLLAAVMRNDPESAQAAVDRGADIERRDGDGCTPLHIAAWEGHAEVLDVLLATGANVESVDIYNNRPLHWAARWGNNAAIARLVEAGADLHSQDRCRRTPLKKASFWGHRYTVELLRTLGARR